MDNNATEQYENVNVKLDYSAGSRVTSFLRTGDFHESRNNGKHSSTDGVGAPEANDTTWRFVNGGTRLDLPGGNEVQASVFSNFETFHSNFLAVPLSRRRGASLATRSIRPSRPMMSEGWLSGRERLAARTS